MDNEITTPLPPKWFGIFVVDNLHYLRKLNKLFKL